MRYKLDFVVKLSEDFIRNKDVDPRLYSRIRSDLCGWMRTVAPTLTNRFRPCPKELKRQYAELSTALNKLDDYYMNRIDYLTLLWEGYRDD